MHASVHAFYRPSLTMHGIQLYAAMPRPRVHVVQMRLTHEEWRLVAEMASLRRLSVEELLREGLRLSRLDAAMAESLRARLRVVAPRRDSGDDGGG